MFVYVPGRDVFSAEASIDGSCVVLLHWASVIPTQGRTILLVCPL